MELVAWSEKEEDSIPKNISRRTLAAPKVIKGIPIKSWDHIEIRKLFESNVHVSEGLRLISSFGGEN